MSSAYEERWAAVGWRWIRSVLWMVCNRERMSWMSRSKFIFSAWVAVGETTGGCWDEETIVFFDGREGNFDEGEGG